MTDDPQDPAISQAMAAYRSAGKLRTPQPAPRIVRLVDEPSQPPATSAAHPASASRVPEPSEALAQNMPGAAVRSAGVSLMITNAQKESLRLLGISEAEIRDMTPAEAHRRLGISGR